MKRIPIDQTKQYQNQVVKVAGWVNSLRPHGKVIFLDLRDKTGFLQIVFSQDSNPKDFQLAKEIRPEWVIEVEGKINRRPKGTENPNLLTGEIEMTASKLKIYSQAKTLPFSIADEGYQIKEEKRLKYRYLDLRRKRLQRNLELRQKIIHFIRSFLIEKGFLEIETPILTKSTPEGARDFLVPARLQPGLFYALPQSPQQYKQLLQVAGFEKYFQIARCFRDEDPRADRQAEFTQLDIEMSFVEQEEVLSLVEEIFSALIKNFFPEKKITKIPFFKMTHQKAIENFQSDRPDLRKNKEDKEELAFGWVLDFPMFEWKEKEKRWDTVHHPFTRPKTEDIEKIKKEPEKILAFQYDLVLNGQELGGGSLRSYKPEILEAVFEVLGHKKKEIKEKFGHLLEAFKYGVPPHGGIALGLDRVLAVILGEKNIREVIAFPKTGDSRDLMMNAPSEVTKEQLEELHLKIVKPKKKK
jgi:aspartyl-tRNA synthetase